MKRLAMFVMPFPETNPICFSRYSDLELLRYCLKTETPEIQ